MRNLKGWIIKQFLFIKSHFGFFMDYYYKKALSSNNIYVVRFLEFFKTYKGRKFLVKCRFIYKFSLRPKFYWKKIDEIKFKYPYGQPKFKKRPSRNKLQFANWSKVSSDSEILSKHNTRWSLFKFHIKYYYNFLCEFNGFDRYVLYWVLSVWFIFLYKDAIGEFLQAQNFKTPLEIVYPSSGYYYPHYPIELAWTKLWGTWGLPTEAYLWTIRNMFWCLLIEGIFNKEVNFVRHRLYAYKEENSPEYDTLVTIKTLWEEVEFNEYNVYWEEYEEIFDWELKARKAEILGLDTETFTGQADENFLEEMEYKFLTLKIKLMKGDDLPDWTGEAEKFDKKWLDELEEGDEIKGGGVLSGKYWEDLRLARQIEREDDPKMKKRVKRVVHWDPTAKTMLADWFALPKRQYQVKYRVGDKMEFPEAADIGIFFCVIAVLLFDAEMMLMGSWFVSGAHDKFIGQTLVYLLVRYLPISFHFVLFLISLYFYQLYGLFVFIKVIKQLKRHNMLYNRKIKIMLVTYWFLLFLSAIAVSFHGMNFYILIYNFIVLGWMVDNYTETLFWDLMRERRRRGQPMIYHWFDSMEEDANRPKFTVLSLTVKPASNYVWRMWRTGLAWTAFEREINWGRKHRFLENEPSDIHSSYNGSWLPQTPVNKTIKPGDFNGDPDDFFRWFINEASPSSALLEKLQKDRLIFFKFPKALSYGFDWTDEDDQEYLRDWWTRKNLANIEYWLTRQWWIAAILVYLFMVLLNITFLRWLIFDVLGFFIRPLRRVYDKLNAWRYENYSQDCKDEKIGRWGEEMERHRVYRYIKFRPVAFQEGIVDVQINDWEELYSYMQKFDDWDRWEFFQSYLYYQIKDTRWGDVHVYNHEYYKIITDFLYNARLRRLEIKEFREEILPTREVDKDADLAAQMIFLKEYHLVPPRSLLKRVLDYLFFKLCQKYPSFKIFSDTRESKGLKS